MARFGMVIDTTRCVGCMDCVGACKTENSVPEGLCRDWIVQEVRGVMPDLQLVRNPANNPNKSSVWVFGMRLIMTL